MTDRPPRDQPDESGISRASIVWTWFSVGFLAGAVLWQALPWIGGW